MDSCVWKWFSMTSAGNYAPADGIDSLLRAFRNTFHLNVAYTLVIGELKHQPSDVRVLCSCVISQLVILRI